MTAPTPPEPADRPAAGDRWRVPASIQPPFFTTPPAQPDQPAQAAQPSPPAPSQPSPYASPQYPTPPDPTPAVRPDPRFGAAPGAAPVTTQAYGYPPPAYLPPGSSMLPPQPYGPPPSYGYGGPGYPSPAAPEGIHGLGVATLVLGAVLIASSVLRALTASAAVRAYDSAAARGGLPGGAYTAHELAQSLAIVALPLWIVGAVWISKAHGNARALAPGQLRRSAVWCWLGWIVPIVQWWFPKQILDDTWRITASAATPNSPGRVRSTGLSWGLWITYTVTLGLAGSYVHAGYSSPGSPFEGQPGSPAYSMVPQIHPGLEILSALAGIAAFAAWIPVVRGISAAQDELRARFGGGTWG